MSATAATPYDPAAAREAFVERVLRAAAGTFELFTLYLGDRLGLYRVLAEDGPLTARQLAGRTGTSERYVREWLEQQTVAGILATQNPEAPSADRLFHLPAGHDEPLTDPDSLDYVAPLGQLLAGAVRPLESLVGCFRSGRGIPYEAFGADLREGQARMNRASFLRLLGREWLPSVPDVHARLTGTETRVADIGCGAGWSSIAIAQSYPRARVDGFDLDAPSVAMAKANVETARLEDRVSIRERDAGDPALAGSYDLVTAFECVHDMSNPVSALATMRRLAKDGGAVIVADERVGDTFTPTGNDVEWLMYGFSVLHCLPVGMAESPSAATGTVMRADTLRGYAEAAGFRRVEVLPIENFFFRFYRLHP